MPISLFEHNATAYAAVLATLAETGRACVIHPTGTGKSFIGFKYCEDHSEQTVLWLAAQRNRLDGKGRPLTPEQVRKLRALGVTASEKQTGVKRAGMSTQNERASL